MSYSFEEIMAYHPDNRIIYNEIKQSLPTLVPFVGAGLTCFSYDGWEQVLDKLTRKITDDKNRTQVENLITNKDFLRAAQRLEELRGVSNLAKDLVFLFSQDRLEKKRNELHKMPIILLPLLFQGLILTTNFDETLETVYRESGYPFQAVLHPGQPELVNHFLKSEGRCLFKLHGTVTGSGIEYSRIVFTQKQYDIHYGKGTPLIMELEKCLKGKAMFFLGCSLGLDRTMEILRNIIEPGEYHYTIIGCKRSERDAKIRELADRNIRAILYEEGRYEAVRVVLERLLEETNFESYQNLRFHIGSLKSFGFSNRFVYNTDIMPLIGRSKELQELESFLDDATISFRWWAVIGPGGCGKSKLVYEFQKYIPFEWTVYYLKDEDYETPFELTTCFIQKTLLIADYVQEHAKELGKIMDQLNRQKRNLPVRILLIERNETNENVDSAWKKQLYMDVKHKKELKDACYRSDFLKLQPLLDNELLEIMEQYASAILQSKGKVAKVLNYTEKQLLIQSLHRIDPEMRRPLYAMFLTDAYIEGQNPKQWDRDSILNYILEREYSRIDFCIRQSRGNRFDRKLYETCLYLKSAATVLQSSTLAALQRLFPEKWNIIEHKVDDFGATNDFFIQSGLAVQDKILALCPDLIGEYFVYDWLFKQETENIYCFLSAVWKIPEKAIAFFRRMIEDYGYLLNENPQQWEILLPDSLQLTADATLPYMYFMMEAIKQCNIAAQYKRLLLNLVERIDKYGHTEETVSIFAVALHHLSCKEESEYSEDAIELLNKLEVSCPDYIVVAITDAVELYNLISKQGISAAQKTLDQMELLASKHPDIDIIITIFANGLFKLSTKQEGLDARKTIKRLELLAMEHSDITEIAIKLSQGLYNVYHDYDIQRLVEYQRVLANKYPGVEEIAVEFAKSLHYMIDRTDTQSAKEILKRLKQLMLEYPSVLKIADAFTSGLCQLILNDAIQNAQEVREAVTDLAELMPKHLNRQDDLNIASSIAYCMLELCDKQDLSDHQNTISQMWHLLLTEGINDPLIAEIFAAKLGALIVKQEELGQDVLENLNLMGQLALDYPQSEHIGIKYAQVLFYMTLNQDKKYMYEIEKHVECLITLHPDKAEIATTCMNTLVNISATQDLPGVQKIIRQMEKAEKNHPNVPEIRVALAYGLVNLSFVQDKEGAQETVERLKKMESIYPDEYEMKIMLAEGLLNLSEKQEIREAKQTIQEMEKLSINYPEEPKLREKLKEAIVSFKKKEL